jgi:uncharacterized protein
MKIALESAGGQYAIRGHRPGEVQINDTAYRASLIVSPQHLIDSWAATAVAALEPAQFDPILALEPEVILIGTGGRLVFPKPDILRLLADAGIGYEFMDTGAACRTYNVLMAESRRVVAGLMIDPDDVD